MKSPLKWVGSKASLVPTVTELWQGHEHRPFVSLFLGGGSVELALNPKSIICNDSNPSLINFWGHLRDRTLQTIAEFRANFPELLDDQNAYLTMRDRLNAIRETGQGINSPLHANLFYAVCRNAFNGLWRTRKDGVVMNVGYRKKWDNGATAEALGQWADAIAHWDFGCRDWSQVDLPSGAFVYADPPYYSETPTDQLSLPGLNGARSGNGFTGYSGQFDWQHQVDLAKALAVHDGPVVLHNADTSGIRELYSSLGFEVQRIKAARSVSCKGDRAPAPEVIATKNMRR